MSCVPWTWQWHRGIECHDHLPFRRDPNSEANESADAHAERHGLFVIQATGSNASIASRQDFRLRMFGRE
jgi:hypothetical protein